MPYHQYMHIHPSKIPQEVKNEYSYEVAADRLVYTEICKGMYGLKESGLIAFNQLFKALAPHGYKPMPNTNGLWQHCTCRTMFALCVNDFGVK